MRQTLIQCINFTIAVALVVHSARLIDNLTCAKMLLLFSCVVLVVDVVFVLWKLAFALIQGLSIRSTSLLSETASQPTESISKKSSEATQRHPDKSTKTVKQQPIPIEQTDPSEPLFSAKGQESPKRLFVQSKLPKSRNQVKNKINKVSAGKIKQTIKMSDHLAP